MNVTSHKHAIGTVFDQAAAEFDQSGVPFFTPLGRRLVEIAAPEPGEHILDVGCGRGSCLFPARDRVGPGGTVTGIDISAEMVRLTADEAQRRGLTNVTLEVMDGERPRFPRDSFDVVLAGFSIMHMPLAPDSLTAYLTVLRPGGRFCFTDLVDDKGLPPFVPAAAFAVLEPHFPAGPNPRERGTASWSSTVESTIGALTARGFEGVRVEEDVFSMTLADGGQWADWSMSTGLRAAWERIPPAQHAGVRARVAQAVQAVARGPGTVTLPVPVRFVTARRPS
ncbi:MULTISPECIES: class I SAM-dependent methyltransferase [Micromonospora]|uniref:class I SAM-dependent methyltransferase n=1 Tax=Micromonospora TaxID=1873 RepID=UPI0033FA6143